MRLLPVLALALTACPKNTKVDLSRFTPKVRYERVDFGKPSFEGVDATFVLAVDNPNPVAVSLARWSWDLDVADRDFLKGSDDDGARLEAADESHLEVPVRLVFADIVDTVKEVRGKDTLPFTVSGELGFATPLGVVDVPWQDSGTLPVLRKPGIKVERLRIDKIDALRGRAELAVDLALEHRGGADLDLSDMDWALTIGGKQLADGTLDRVASLEDGAAQTVSLPVGFNLPQLGALVVKKLQDRQPVDVGFAGTLSVGTPLGTLPLDADWQGTAPVE